MPSTNEYLTYVLDLLREVDGITFKKMMGEFLLYKDGVLFGGVYDDRFLVKKAATLTEFGMSEDLPYEGAKPMFVVDSDDSDEVRQIVEKAVAGISKR